MAAPQFTEALFQQCVNHELSTRWKGLVVGGVPAMPSQMMEALSGYDTAYKLTSGKQVFLQYKVAQHALKPSGPGAATFHLWGGPYLRAYLHRHSKYGFKQHNLLVNLCQPPDIACYCAPCFHTARELGSLYQSALQGGAGVLSKTLFAPLYNVPQITSGPTHSITYPEDGAAFRLHSEPSEPFDALDIDQLLRTVEPTEWSAAHFDALESRLVDLRRDYRIGPREARRTPVDPEETSLARIGRMLTELGLVMVLIPEQADRR